MRPHKLKKYIFKSKIIFLFLLSIFLSCQEKLSQTTIKGSIPNLPDGVIYLYNDLYSNRIDSAKTKDGKFVINHNWENEKQEPAYLGLDHIDKNGVLRAISFPTNSKFRGSGYHSQYFFSDSIININGFLDEFHATSVNLSDKIKIVVSPRINAGYQTRAMYDIDGDLFNEIDNNTHEKVAIKIIEYPNSFHLLFNINDNRNSFTTSQTKRLLSLFGKEIKNSATYKQLSNYNKQRINKNKLIVPLLNDSKGIKVKILDDKYQNHLVIFWASWCGPCRQEIPSLKKLYLKYKNNLEFVSISTDVNTSEWEGALKKERMPWKQLNVNKKDISYESVEMFFQVSKSIPYMALINKNMKVIKSHVGLMTESELKEFINK